MRGGSIRLRLLFAAAISVVAALAIAGVGLTYLFERHVERRVQVELETHMRQLIAGLTLAADGSLTVVDSPTDPRFATPLSGLYWQVEDLASGALTRSRSLWDRTLRLPKDDVADGAIHVHEIGGFDGAGTLVVLERRISIGESPGRSYLVVVAINHREVEVATRDFAFDLVPSLALLAAVLILAAFAQVVVGLRPLERLRNGLRAVVAGRASRLIADVPQEVRPLVDEINHLLDGQEKALIKARTAAADLAHGLKTPLQVLAADIRTLHDKGEEKLAEGIGEVAETIRRHVERELARARAAPAIAASVESNVATVAESVIGVVKRTPNGESLVFRLDVGRDVTAPLDSGDLAEILGNLVENASRFARTKVVVAASAAADRATISVADDGPGIAAEKRATALSRGTRLDLRGGGAGLGLAIVADIVEAYGGTFALEDANPGLLCIVEVPRHPPVSIR